MMVQVKNHQANIAKKRQYSYQLDILSASPGAKQAGQCMEELHHPMFWVRPPYSFCNDIPPSRHLTYANTCSGTFPRLELLKLRRRAQKWGSNCCPDGDSTEQPRQWPPVFEGTTTITGGVIDGFSICHGLSLSPEAEGDLVAQLVSTRNMMFRKALECNLEAYYGLFSCCFKPKC